MAILVFCANLLAAAFVGTAAIEVALLTAAGVAYFVEKCRG